MFVFFFNKAHGKEELNLKRLDYFLFLECFTREYETVQLVDFLRTAQDSYPHPFQTNKQASYFLTLVQCKIKRNYIC